ncbi:MAG: RNA-binding protein [Hyphomonadaceae bacterium]|nr:RNA-binding protein [Hyphomonadaceae bacterium]
MTGRSAMAKKKAEPEKNAAAVALGRLGGLKGGAARAKSLSKKRRSEIAKKAAAKRWAKKDT